nr:neuronal acetylcholine receptor subunit non-alpha-2 [Onthophagus taurus]
MHFILFISVFSINFDQISSIIYKENITDFSKCKTHFSSSQGEYTDFFQIINRESNSTQDLIVDFHFSVLAQSDAHILLTPSKRINNKDPVYEIVLGAGRNSYSSIRRALRTQIKSTIRHKTKLLSFYEPQSFWLHVSRNGLIEIGRETQYLPFLTWIDPDPIPLEYFSLSTWPGIEAKWFYDCYKIDVKEVGKVLSNRERLLEDYLKNYSIFDVPIFERDKKIDVFLNLKPVFMSLNEPERKLESRFILTQKWIDSKLQWNSTNYGNIQSIQPHIYQIWTPNTRFFSVVDDFEKSSKNTKLHVTQNGEVTLQANLELKTWCNPADLDDWPNDKHICIFPIGVFVDSNKINLHYDNGSSETNKTIKNLVYKTEWDIESVDFKNGYIENNEKIDFEIIYRLKKISSVYFTIYFAPIISN